MNKDKSLLIFMITNNYTPYSGGVVSALDTYKTELIKLGHKVIIVTLDFLGQNTKEDDIIRLSCPIRFTYNKNHMAIPIRPKAELYKLIETHRPDIIHTHHPFLLGYYALKASKKYNIPIVFTYHTLYENYLHYLKLPEFITKPITNILVKQFCSKIDKLIVPSESVNHYVNQKNIAKNALVVPTGILPIFIKPEFNYKLNNNRFKLLTVSRFTKEKNIKFLLDAYKQLDSTKFSFTLVGFGAQQQELEEYAYTKLKLSAKDVIFITKPEKRELVHYYDNSNLFIFGSTSETQGLVLAESMARGTPVIALNGPGSIDIIKQNVNGFIINNNKEMVDAINNIAQDHKLYQNLQYQAWLTGKEYWPANCASKLDYIYKNALKTNL